jgi:hypothetical protein
MNARAIGLLLIAISLMIILALGIKNHNRDLERIDRSLPEGKGLDCKLFGLICNIVDTHKGNSIQPMSGGNN